MIKFLKLITFYFKYFMTKFTKIFLNFKDLILKIKNKIDKKKEISLNFIYNEIIY